jgi:DNA-cytosine methyltransferase
MHKILSLFDGISVAQVAINRAGIKNYSYYASEVDQSAISITQKNYPDTTQLGCVKSVPTDLTDVWLIVGGSPCQDLSVANKHRKGLDGERSGLFFDYVRLVKEIKPQFFILENVASMPPESRKLMSQCLFNIEPVMIDATLVSAQSRKRFFWVGKLVDGVYYPVKISQPANRRLVLRHIMEPFVDDKYFTKMDFNKSARRARDYKIHDDPYAQQCWALRASDYRGTHNVIRIDTIGKGGQAERIYSIDGKSTNLIASGGGGGGAKTGLYLVDEKIRRLTPIECERLQGLPDNYTDGISDTQRYKCLGNAFNADVVAHIISQLAIQPVMAKTIQYELF